MRRPLVLFALTFFLCYSLLTANPLQARYLTFTARDENGIYLRDLGMDEVSLFLDDQPVEVRYLGAKNVETVFGFLIENSPRTAPFAKSLPQFGRINVFDQVRYALMNGFFWSVLESGSVLIAEFYKDFNIVQDFTDQADEVEYALARLKPNFSGLDKENIPIGRMLGRGVDRLKVRSEKRKILVLVTSTVDRESYKHLDEYRRMLALQDIELYVISFSLRAPSGPGFTYLEKRNYYFFRKLVGETGGKLYISGDYRYVDEFTDDLMSRLSHSYTIGFYIDAQDEPTMHSVRLLVRSPGVQVSHRERILH